jgi:hypothetical protein
VPGRHPGRWEGCTTHDPLAGPESALDELHTAFTAQTGFRLVTNLQTSEVSAPTGCFAKISEVSRKEVVEIPLARIRLNSYQQSLSLDPAKLQKAIERARRMGITPPIQVRRVRDGYVLSDSLYRLRAAEVLGLERIPALVE